MRIALTGGIACGKSLLSKCLSEAGVETLDADDVVHNLESPGGEAADAVFSRFGTLDRAELASLCFGQDRGHLENRRDLESILFPLVRKTMLSWCGLRGVSVCADRPRVAVIPLLFESGWSEDFDFVVCVTASRERQVKRMMENRGMTYEAAEARIAAQMPVEEKEMRSDWVIRNDGTEDELKREADRLAAFLKEKCKNEQ